MKFKTSSSEATRVAEAGPTGSASSARYPFWIKLISALTLFNSWILLEETVIDRHDLWKYFPYYTIAQPCVWDAAAAILIVIFVWIVLRGK